MAKINEKIKHYRELRGVGIGELALVTNVPYSNIKSFEEGTLMPSLQVLKRISEALNIDYKELNVEEDKKEMIKDTENKKEMVNHPDHYAWLKELCGIEPIDICRHLDFNCGSAVKYLLRKGKKEMNLSEREQRVQDLSKAIFYLQDEIKMLEN